MPRRLPGLDYRGFYRYSITCCVRGRRRVFVAPTVVAPIHEQLLRTATEQDFAVLAYCYMPDHLHVLVSGESPAAVLPAFVGRFKQASGFAYRQTHVARLWQRGYYDHVLRSQESTRAAMRYIFDNPVRAGLVRSPLDYPFSGSQLGSLADILGDLDSGSCPPG